MNDRRYERDREMILSPLRWPQAVLPLTRKGEVALFAPPLSVQTVPVDEPIEIVLANMWDNWRDAPRKRYDNVDALLVDGWKVD